MSSRSVHATKAKVNPIPFTALPDDVQKGHIPIIAVDYKDKDLAKEKELIIDFETGNLYIVSKDDDTVLINLLEVLAHDYLTNINGSKTWVTISGIEGAVNLSSILNEINKYKIEHLVAEDEDTAIKGRIDSIRYDDKSIEEKLFVLLKDFDEAGDLAIPRKTEDGTGIEWMTAKDIGLDPSEPTIGARKNIIDIFPTPREPDQNVFVLYTKPYARSTVEVEGTYYVRLPKSIPTYHTITWKVSVKKKTVLIFDDNIDWYPNTDSSIEDIHTITIYPNGDTYIGDPPLVEPSISDGTSCNIFFYISTWDKGRRWQILLDKSIVEPPAPVYPAIFNITPISQQITDYRIIFYTTNEKDYTIECLKADGITTLSKTKYKSSVYVNITIPSGTAIIKAIGDFEYMFYGSSDKVVITGIDIPKMPSLRNIHQGTGIMDLRITQSPTIRSFSLGENRIRTMYGMFENCKDLVSIPLLDTSNATQMICIFNNCKSLIAIPPNFNTSKVTSLLDSFNGCEQLTTIPYMDTSNVTDVRGTFRDCVSLTTIPLLDTSQVTDMSLTFYGCTKLINIPKLNTSKVTSMYSMFNGCTSLSTIPELDTSSVTDMNYMFYGCTNLINIPKLNTSNVIDMMCTFYNCSKLISIPVLDTSKVTSMSSMFNGCVSLISINELDISKAGNTSNMFKDCIKLSGTITVKNKNTYQYSEMFKGCSSGADTEFIVKYIDEDTKEIAKKMVETKMENNHVYLYEEEPEPTYGLFTITPPQSDRAHKINCTTVDGSDYDVWYLNFRYLIISEIKCVSGVNVSVSAPIGTNFIKIIGDFTSIIYHVQSPTVVTFKEIDIPSMPNLEQIYGLAKGQQNSTIVKFSLGENNIKDMTGLFKGCKNLTSIPFLYTSKVTNMKEMFDNCYKLPSIPLLDTSNVTNMANMFSDCSKLTTIPLLDTSKVTNMKEMFGGCLELSSVPLLNTSKVTLMYHMFNRCISLTSIPEFDTSNVTDMQSMFYNSALTTIPPLDTSKVTSMYSMFERCWLLTSIPSLNTVNVTTMKNMFNGCTALETIPALNTSKVTDMSYMFNGCTKLMSIPSLNYKKVTNMSYMFYGCIILESISNFDITLTKDTSYMFCNCYALSGKIKIAYSGITTYGNMFTNCSKNVGAKLVVNYSNATTKTLASKLIATKSLSSNIVLGTNG